MSGLAFVSRMISRATLMLAGVGLLAMTGIIGWQVFARYVLNASPAWAEQAALVLLIWYVMIAAAVGVREGFHIALELGEGAMSERANGVVRVIAMIVTLAFGAAMGVWGGELVARVWSHDIPTLGLSRGFAYLPLPIAGWLMVFFAIEHLIAESRGERVEPLWR
ncbi:TRAP transporter small permease [Brevundimonas sp.]|jgi:TRAP-type C4-dicarboxylate transport system permease small subunit|uniref:TRAP transporter small permease n=1 Tax=Brevundimonas sp. TaxID=1871086 RepID=UPI003919625B|nr:TRAP transporter small permease [Brevundimonas sp.]MCA3717036.1 TRAP transporter small permease [Brevundimonas sp.]